MTEDEDILRPIVQIAVQEFLEAETNEALGAGKSERSAERLGDRSGYYPRKLILRHAQIKGAYAGDRAGRFSTEIFARYQRSEKASWRRWWNRAERDSQRAEPLPAGQHRRVLTNVCAGRFDAQGQGHQRGTLRA